MNRDTIVKCIDCKTSRPDPFSIRIFIFFRFDLPTYLNDHFFGFADAVVHASHNDGQIFDVLVLTSQPGIDMAQRSCQGIAELSFAQFVALQFTRLLASRSHQSQNGVANVGVSLAINRVGLVAT